MKFKHTSVLLHETIDNLKPKNDGLYVDATFGGGGHAKYLLSKIDTGTLIGFDQDEYAIKSAELNFANLSRIVSLNYNLYMTILAIWKRIWLS